MIGSETRRFSGPAAARAARALRRLQRDGLGHVTSVSRDGDALEVTVDSPAGVPLGRLAPVEAKRLLRDLCGELAQAHAAGWVHGRLVPESVVVAGRGYAIRDLAFAQAEARVAGDEPRDERDDVRGVGAVAYWALTGEAPLRASAEVLPPALRPLVLRCLHDDPGRRFGSLDELLAALGAPRTAPRRRAPWLVAAALLVVIGAGVGLAATAARAPRPAAPPPAAPAPEVAPALDRRPVLAVGDLGDRELSERVIAGLVDEERVEVTRAAPLVDGTAFALTGRIVDGGKLEISLYDSRRRALALASRVPPDADAVLAAVRPALGLAAGRPVAEVTTRSPEAWRAYVAGLAALERGEPVAAARSFRAAAADPGFAAPRLRLARLAGGAERDALVAELGPLATRGRSAAELRAVAARSPAEEVAALEALRSGWPHDATVGADLARAYRAARRPADCAAEAERAGLRAELAWCRLEAGDGDGALAAAAGDNALAGELALALARYGSAREAFHGDPARLALVAFHQQGRCKTLPPERDDETVARVRAILSYACGERAPAPAGRASRVQAILGGAEPGPLDGLPLLEPPILFDVALERLDRRDVAAGRAACAALPAETALAAYCLGRAAEAEGDAAGAARAYRTFLERWADADPDNRWWRDARRRLALFSRKP